MNQAQTTPAAQRCMGKEEGAGTGLHTGSRRLYEIIENSARRAINWQAEDGSMPAGHNGPYYDQETPVRNTAHWIITLLKSYDISNDKSYLDAADRASDYLLSKEARPMGATFWCRRNSAEDACNGLVGQAWIIEALVAASNALGRRELYSVAEEVFMLHPWNETLRAWRCVHVDGHFADFDRTLNHQLWFAASGSLLTKTPEALRRTKAFAMTLPDRLHLYGNGVIRHLHRFFLISNSQDRFCAVAKHILRRGPKVRWMYTKSVGYHSFHLYALAMLKHSFPEIPLWTSRKISDALDCTRHPWFEEELKTSKYGYAYNPPGLEMAYALQTFRPDAYSEITTWLRKQLTTTYDFHTGLMERGAADPVTSAARIYEATRLSDYEIQLDS